MSEVIVPVDPETGLPWKSACPVCFVPAFLRWAGAACAVCGTEPPARPDVESTVETLRELLVEWERYARTLADAGVIAIPERLLERTVGLLDATAV